MAEATPSADGAAAVSAAPVTTAHQRALSQIQLNKLIIDSETGTSSDDEAANVDCDDEDAGQSLVGVSLGHEQRRLAAPETPAIEKAAAMERFEGGGFFDSVLESHIEDHDGESPEREPSSQQQDERVETHRRVRSASQTISPESSITLPSPWRAGPRMWKDRGARQPSPVRRNRASTSAFESTLDTFKKYIPTFSTPSFTSFSSTSHKSKNSQDGLGSFSPERSNSSQTSPSVVDDSAVSSSTTLVQDSRTTKPIPDRTPGRDQVHFESIQPRSARPGDLYRTQSGQRSIRRSMSESSLRTTLSRAPTLGDDSRFEHVHEQVNSRFRAIRDSLQDSNLKLPSLPSLPSLPGLPSLPNLGIMSSSKTESRDDLSQATSTKSAAVSPAPPNRRGSPVKDHAGVGTQGPAGMTSTNAAMHPQFTKAIEELTGDLVVLGGYRGSVLRSAEPPNKQLWVPVKVGLNIRKVNLEVGLEDEDEERMEETIIPSGMLSHIGPVDISRRLFKRLRACKNVREGKLRVWDYGYDWRLSPDLLSKRFIAYLENIQRNRPAHEKEKGTMVVAHSLGGLITRHAVNQRPDLFAGVVYAGVPKTCVNILGPLRDGDSVLLSSRVLAAQVNFTIRTSFALLPLDGRCFFNGETHEEYPVDFFDPQTWVDLRLTPVLAPPLPPFNPPTNSGSNSIGSILDSVTTSLRRTSLIPGGTRRDDSVTSTNSGLKDSPATDAAKSAGVEPGMDMSNGAHHHSHHPSTSSEAAASVATATTLPYDAAYAYLSRTLSRIKTFKEALVHDPELQAANAYPPHAVIFGKSTPTVFGARVVSREAIAHSDAYDHLAFASGDGVVLAKASMLPDGYVAERNGIVATDRGHIGILGDLEAVGRALRALVKGRRRGVGLGVDGEGQVRDAKRASTA